MKKFRLVWSEERHTLGIASIDRQHEELMQLINGLGETVEGEYDNLRTLEVMDRIVRTVAAHFSHEESLMRLHGFPEMSQHMAQHKKMLREVITLMTTLEKGQPQKAIIATAFLADCIEHHIQGDDREIARFLIEKGLV